MYPDCISLLKLYILSAKRLDKEPHEFRFAVRSARSKPYGPFGIYYFNDERKRRRLAVLLGQLL